MCGRVPEKTATIQRAREGFRGHPAATIAYYGPDNTRASKVAVGIFLKENEAANVIERLFAKEEDARHDPAIQEKILKLIKTHTVRSVAVTEGIIGCPHEEGIDFPEGKSCPHCLYWAGRDRITLERIQ
ncbi:MAG TPA: hypothetical protein VG028_05980 [Terriglobia bacterium]|nr:hypothetical protein [Terriglobia bacterium]